jgi:FAD/FMN-containing dehydrogenase
MLVSERWVAGAGSRVLTTVLAAVCLAAGVAACGGSSSGSSPGTAAPTSAPADTTTATSVAADETAAPSASGDRSSEFCNRARQLRTGFNPFGDIAMSTDPTEMKRNFEAGTVVFDGLYEVRPVAIGTDMDVIKSGIAAFHAGADRLGWDILAIAQDAGLAVYMGEGSVKIALDHVHAYLLDVCGVSPTFGT